MRSNRGQAITEFMIIVLHLLAFISFVLFTSILKWNTFALEQTLYEGTLCLADYNNTVTQCETRANQKAKNIFIYSQHVSLNLHKESDHFKGSGIWSINFLKKQYSLKKSIKLLKQQLYPNVKKNVLTRIKDLYI